MNTTKRSTPDGGPSLSNGHAANNAHVNGHANEPAASSNGACEKDSSPQARARAASDDPHAVPSATAAVPPPASTARDASAEVARVSKSKKGRGKRNGKTSAKRAKPEPPPPLPPGELPLPENGSAFVGAVHGKADIIEAGRRLLNSKDEKVIKSVWDRLVNLKYGNTPEQTDEDLGRVIVGMPRPIRNKPPQPPEQGT